MSFKQKNEFKKYVKLYFKTLVLFLFLSTYCFGGSFSEVKAPEEESINNSKSELNNIDEAKVVDANLSVNNEGSNNSLSNLTDNNRLKINEANSTQYEPTTNLDNVAENYSTTNNSKEFEANNNQLANELNEEHLDAQKDLKPKELKDSVLIASSIDEPLGEQKNISDENEIVDNDKSFTNTEDLSNRNLNDNSIANSTSEDLNAKSSEALEADASSVKKDSKPAAKSGKPINLFGYVEFRGALKNLPKWKRVLDEDARIHFFKGDEGKVMSPAVFKKWEVLKKSLENASLKEKVQKVNVFFNQWPYKTDISLWGVEDYWETPHEFIQKSGDCEDYAITKYFALRSLGVPAELMRVVVVKETIRGIGHAVLVVFIDDNAYILDNLTNLVLPHSKLLNYEPKVSVNEEYRWAHVKPVVKK